MIYDKYLSSIKRRTSTEIIVLQNQRLVDRFTASQHYDVLTQQVDGEHTTICLTPFKNGFVSARRVDLKRVSDERKAGRSWWKGWLCHPFVQ